MVSVVVPTYSGASMAYQSYSSPSPPLPRPSHWPKDPSQYPPLLIVVHACWAHQVPPGASDPPAQSSPAAAAEGHSTRTHIIRPNATFQGRMPIGPSQPNAVV